MLRPRLVVFLMIKDGYIKKSKSFGDYRYIGDPLNTIKIFSDFLADELVLVDIDATQNKCEPNYALIKNIASISRMPICYGGGINQLSQIEKIISLGVEKVSICSASFSKKDFVKEAVLKFGAQSVIGCIDTKYKKTTKQYEVYIDSGKIKQEININNAIDFFVSEGVGEIIINNISLDGTYQGYDKNLIKHAVKRAPIPVTALGGASSLDNIKQLWQATNVSGIAAGSLWSFFGENGPVLINYPNQEIINDLFPGL
jgi:cyclase